ncbi:MAG: PAS domain S-box protein [Deltaproteobacteria bacterium]|nr:PAS domain S-box protein [Deltaproteobacteria bacterium]
MPASDQDARHFLSSAAPQGEPPEAPERLVELIAAPEIEATQAALARALGVRVAVRDRRGQVVLATDWEAGSTDEARYPLVVDGEMLGALSIAGLAGPIGDPIRGAALAESLGRNLVLLLALRAERRDDVAERARAEEWRIVERQRAQAELAESAALLERTFESVQDAYLRVDRRGRLTRVSPSAATLYAFESTQAMIGTAAVDYYESAEDRDRVQAALKAQGFVHDHVARSRRRDGSLFWASMNAHYLRDDAGRVTGIECFVRDISERMQAQASMREHDAKYRAAFLTGPDAFYWASLEDGRFHEVNTQFELLFGYTREEVVGKTSLELGLYADPRDRARMVALVEQHGAVHGLDLRGVKKGGEVFDASFSGSVVVQGGEKYLLGVLRDVTERKRAELELERYRTHLEAMVEQRTREVELLNQLTFVALESASVGAWWLEPDRAETYFALDTTARLIGVPVARDRTYSTEAWLALLRETQVAYPEHAAAIDETIDQFAGAVSGKYPRYRAVYPLAIPGQPLRWIDARADVATRDAEGRPRLMTGTVIDVTKLIETERELKAHKVELEALVARRTDELAQRNRELQVATERLTLATQAANMGVWDWDVVENRLVWDDGMYRLYGLTRDAFAGAYEAFTAAVHPDEREAVERFAEAALRGEHAYDHEFRVVRPDGGVRHIRSSALTFRAPDGRPLRMVGVNFDTTETRLAQAERESLHERLRASQKMEAIGLLAGGVAHDFNNLLSVILSFTGFAMADLPDGDPRKGDLTEVSNAAQRAVALTRQLLAFSRKQVFKPVVLDLNAIVRGVEKILLRLIREDIALTLALAPDLGATRADPGQLEQVLMNLVVNARDAMPAGGHLRIATANVALRDPAPRELAELPQGSYVELVVSDTGHGMDEATRARIFEPFFTTKELGKGTGLGLATVFGIVKQSGGEIQVSSEPGRGCTFRVLLPRENDARARPVSASDTGPRARPGSETILLVEDEDALRNAARRVLEQAGYQVLLASNGRVGLEVLAQHSGRIHLLLSDVVMPEMAGDELARQARALEPRMKVLFMSGYSHEAIARYGVLEPGTKLLSKPFTGSDLQRMVREVLDAE